MLQDEATYGPNTDKFLPERFLTPGVKDPTIAFGFGRRQGLFNLTCNFLIMLVRICPGRYLADNSIYIAVASILSAFDITSSRDDKGKEIPVRAAFRSGFFS
jgi:cytochrome P450